MRKRWWWSSCIAAFIAFVSVAFLHPPSAVAETCPILGTMNAVQPDGDGIFTYTLMSSKPLGFPLSGDIRLLGKQGALQVAFAKLRVNIRYDDRGQPGWRTSPQFFRSFPGDIISQAWLAHVEGAPLCAYIRLHVAETTEPGLVFDPPLSRRAVQIALAERAPAVPTSALARPMPQCSTPDIPAHLIAAVQAVLPPGYSAHGVSQIKIALDAQSRLSSMSVFKSSGDMLLDQRAMTAVRESTWQTAIIGCVAQPGTYIYRVEFPP